jgi:hypothetical protein
LAGGWFECIAHPVNIACSRGLVTWT